MSFRKFCRWLLLLPLLFALSTEGGHADAATGKAQRKSIHKTKGKGTAGARHLAGRARVAASNKRSPAKPSSKAASGARRVPAVKSGLPNVQALGALVLDENGHEIYARNPDGERPIASISKLAATLVIIGRGLELEGLTTIIRSDVEVTRGGAKSRLLEGMTLSNRDLLHAALMGSDNRAIPALGRAVKLTPSQLAASMTAKARELGLKRTRFHDPTGLSIENVSTPRETIALLRAVMRNPTLGPITQRVEYDAHPIGRPPIIYVNTYRPAVRSNVQVLGGKTGYNDDARYCLVLAARIEGHTFYMSFLSNEGKLTRFGDVARVADWMASRTPKTDVASLGGSPVALTRPVAVARSTGPARPVAQIRASDQNRPSVQTRPGQPSRLPARTPTPPAAADLAPGQQPPPIEDGAGAQVEVAAPSSGKDPDGTPSTSPEAAPLPPSAPAGAADVDSVAGPAPTAPSDRPETH